MAVPKATYSTINNLAVIPDKWDSYPNIDRSTVTSCKFISVDSETKIDRSVLNHVTIDGEEGPSSIGRSNIAGSKVVCSYIDRSELRDCPLIHKSKLERSTLSGCPLNEAHIERSTLRDCKVARTKMERSTLTNCKTYDCRLSRCTFEGMTMQYGVWENNNLVGRIGQNEVVFKKWEAEIPKQQAEGVAREDEKLSHPPEMGDNMRIHIAQTPAPSKAAAVTGDEKMPLPEDDSYSRATGLTDEEESTVDSPHYTPVSDSPPPYEP